jgi:hypothetical protein
MSTVSKSRPDSVLVKAAEATVEIVTVPDGVTPTNNVLSVDPEMVLVNWESAGVNTVVVGGG